MLVVGYKSFTFPTQRLADILAHIDETGIPQCPLLGTYDADNLPLDNLDVDPLCDIHVSRMDLSEQVKSVRLKNDVARNSTTPMSASVPSEAPAPVEAPVVSSAE